MKKYMLLYKGPATPPDASHEQWPIWFNEVGNNLVNMGSPMDNGFVLDHDGVTSRSSASLNGYSVIQAEAMSDVISLVKNHPFLGSCSNEYSIEIFELAR